MSPSDTPGIMNFGNTAAWSGALKQAIASIEDTMDKALKDRHASLSHMMGMGPTQSGTKEAVVATTSGKTAAPLDAPDALACAGLLDAPIIQSSSPLDPNVETSLAEGEQLLGVGAAQSEKIAALESMLAQMRDHHVKLEESVKKWKEAHRQSQQELDSVTQDLQTTKISLAQSNIAMERSRADVDVLKRTNASSMKDQQDEQDGKIKSLEAELVSAKDQITSLENLVDQQKRDQTEKIEQMTQRILEAEMTHLTEKETLMNELEMLRMKRDSGQMEADAKIAPLLRRLDAHQAQMAQRTATIDDLSQQLKCEKKIRLKAEARLEGLEIQAQNEAQLQTREVAALKDELILKRAELAALSDQHSDVLRSLAELENTKADLTLHMEQLKDEFASVKAAAAAQTTALAPSDESVLESPTTPENMDLLFAHLRVVSSSRDALAREVEQLEEQIQAVQSNMDALKLSHQQDLIKRDKDYEAVLLVLGEKTEECEALQSDLFEVKEAFRQQLAQLISPSKPSESTEGI